MTTVEERAPLTFHTPTDRDAIVYLLAKAERLAGELADAYREAQRIITGTTDLDPHVDLGDPLARFRLPSGMVGYETTYADHLAPGDWVQACHGDEGKWHEVTEALCFTGDDGRPWVKATVDGTCRFWLATNAIRVARPAADVIAAQEWDR